MQFPRSSGEIRRFGNCILFSVHGDRHRYFAVFQIRQDFLLMPAIDANEQPHYIFCEENDGFAEYSDKCDVIPRQSYCPGTALVQFNTILIESQN